MEATLTILYVEDDPEAFLYMKIILERKIQRKVNLIWASNGKEALRIFKREEIHLILMDLLLPDICGLDLLEKIRENGIVAPVVIITGNGDEKVATEAFKKGVIDYIIKDGKNRSELERNLNSYIDFACWLINAKSSAGKFEYAKRRDSIIILTEILKHSVSGIKKTHLIYKTNLNSETIKRYIWYAIKNGYLQWRREGKEGIFLTTPKGMELLSKVCEIRELLISNF